MTKEEYFALPGLSHSGMRDMAVSPLHYWYYHINPAAPVRPATPEMILGEALHCSVLEAKTFESRYAIAPSIEDYEVCLVTMDDIREWLRSKGITPRGKLKAEIVGQALAVEGCPAILDWEVAQAAERNAGKVILDRDNWTRVKGMAAALANEPRLEPLLAQGEPEVVYQVTDPHTDVKLKGRLDWSAPGWFLDLKTFSCKRTDDIDRVVTQAIWFEKYYQKAYVYAMLRGWPAWKGDVVFAFVESSEPYEVRLRSFLPKNGAQANVYWTRAAVEVRKMVHQFKECSEHFGLNPWRYAQEISPLIDEEIPQLAY